MVVPRVQMPASTFHQGASAGKASKSTRGFSRPSCGGNGLRVIATTLLTRLSASACCKTDWPTKPVAPASRRTAIACSLILLPQVYGMELSTGDFRLCFAYLRTVTPPLKTVSPSGLGWELSQRNSARAGAFAAEMSYGAVPSIVYAENEAGQHGNFLPASYKRILQQAGWKSRLAKVYTGTRFIPRKADRKRRELECANSSDALLMNIFCYPRVLCRTAVCSLLGIEPGLHPEFGFRPGIPLRNGREDRSEMDLKLGGLLVEAKLTEGDFQSTRHDLVHRYRDLELVFDVDRLPQNQQRFRSCQLIRGALAAHAHAASFAVFCDQRRQDLIEDCFEIMSAVVSAELRCRMSVVTWQELAATMPKTVRLFLAEKYGIIAGSIADG